MLHCTAYIYLASLELLSQVYYDVLFFSFIYIVNRVIVPCIVIRDNLIDFMAPSQKQHIITVKLVRIITDVCRELLKHCYVAMKPTFCIVKVLCTNFSSVTMKQTWVSQL